MLGKIKGVSPRCSRIQRQHPKALPFWCAAHQLNRFIAQAHAVQVAQAQVFSQ